MFDYVALIFGGGVIGLLTGFVLGAVLFFVLQVPLIFGIAVAKFCLVYIPLAFSAFFGLFVAFWQDAAVELFGRIWRLIVLVLKGDGEAH